MKCGDDGVKRRQEENGPSSEREEKTPSSRRKLAGHSSELFRGTQRRQNDASWTPRVPSKCILQYQEVLGCLGVFGVGAGSNIVMFRMVLRFLNRPINSTLQLFASPLSQHAITATGTLKGFV